VLERLRGWDGRFGRVGFSAVLLQISEPSVNVQAHTELKARIWDIANRLRGPYRPPQYRLVVLPVVLRPA